MYYKLIRKPAECKAVRGMLYRTEHRYSGSAGEYKEYLHPVCETLENVDYLIPTLVYKISVTQSPKFKRLLPLLEQVPGRDGIRIHRGTHPKHSKGCILVPQHMEKALTDLFLNQQRTREEIRLEICNYTNLNLKQQ